MPTRPSARLTTHQTECRFMEWIGALNSSPEMNEEVKKRFLKELRETRHVMLVDMRQFFKHAINEENMGDDYPFVICTKGSPFALLESYPEVDAATKFCESVGLSWEIHIYPKVSSEVH